MRILFYGDSITDAGRNRDAAINTVSALGNGYVRVIADRLIGRNPEKYEIINRGISGNRVVDLYSRIKIDAWNLKPDIISILIGINDIWHEITRENGVELERFETIYRIMLQDTIKALPDVKLILCEPFVLEGSATQNTEEVPNRYERFSTVYQYAEVVKKLAEEFNIPFIPLQAKFTQAAQKTKAEYYLLDGVHPHVAGATLIADEWVNAFEKEF